MAGLFWYHTFDLPDGSATPGLYDTRPVLDKIPLPEDVSGLRCLDAAASDGFFGFELARRGASEVVSLDLADNSQQDYQRRHDTDVGKVNDRPTACFELIKAARAQDNITRVDMSLYDANPDAIGTFDFVFVGNILLHLSDPIRALAALFEVVKPGGRLLSVETVAVGLSLLTRQPVASLFQSEDDGGSWRNDFNMFWIPNASAHRGVVRAGGFDVVDHSKRLFFQPVGGNRPRRPRTVPRSLREVRYWTVTRPFGLPSSWVLGERTH